MKPRVLIGLLPLLLVHCAGDRPPPAEDTAPLNPAADFAPRSGEPSVDDLARFLAGRPVRAGAELSRWQATNDDYIAYAMETDYLWRKIGLPRTRDQSAYFESTLRPVLGSSSTVVYPFGGPDLLHAASVFPRASTYVLVGLEPVGSLPDLGSGNPNATVARMARVMEEPLRHGYFITEEMRSAPAATPILLTSLGLLGARVDSVQPVSAGGRSGVELRFRHNGRSKRAIYVSADLSNSGFGGFRPWLDQYSGATAYFKAASYLAHDGSFSGIRDWVMSNCRGVLQDDSGIPYKYYVSGNWDVTLLGSYERPIPLFARWRQPELAAAYDAIGGRGPAIPFGSGYHLRKGEANLQVCRRR